MKKGIIAVGCSLIFCAACVMHIANATPMFSQMSATDRDPFVLELDSDDKFTIPVDNDSPSLTTTLSNGYSARFDFTKAENYSGGLVGLKATGTMTKTDGASNNLKKIKTTFKGEVKLQTSYGTTFDQTDINFEYQLESGTEIDIQGNSWRLVSEEGCSIDSIKVTYDCVTPIEHGDENYSEDFVSVDENYHAHICSCCGAMKDREAHVASDWIVDEENSFSAAGSRHKECTVCGYVMQTEELAKKTISWTGVSIEKAEDKVYFVLAGSSTGITASKEITDVFQFKLKTSGADVKRTQADFTVASFSATTGDFVLKTDVTGLPYATNPPYYTNIGIGTIGDFKPEDGVVTESTIKLNGITYELFYAKDSGDKIDGYGTVSLRVSESVSTTFSATGAHLETSDSAVYYVITGSSTGFLSSDELSDALLFQLKTSGANVKRTQSDVDVTLNTQTGEFSLKVDVTDLASATNPPYYTNIGITGPGIKDFKPADETKVIQETVKLNGKQYELKYVKGATNAANGYGCVSIYVSTAGEVKFTPASASLEVIDDNAYYVVTGTCENVVSLDELKEKLVLELRASGSSVVAGTSKEGCLYEFDKTKNSFTLKVKVTDVAVRANPYYSRLGVLGVYVTGTQYPNFNTVDAANVSSTPVTVAGKTFTILFDKTATSSAALGYGTICLKVETAA